MVRFSARFYAELNDFLPAEKRFLQYAVDLPAGTSIGAFLLQEGVPHDAVDLVLVNSESVEFSRSVQEGDRLSVYPVFESFDISPVLKVRARPLRQPRFVLDVHLGKLSSLLRMLGFDALYRNDATDDDLLSVSRGEGRLLLSRDRKLVEQEIVAKGYRIRSQDPLDQLKEVLQRFDLLGSITPFIRCLRCNALLEPVPKEVVIDRLPPRVRRSFEIFWMCSECRRVYWKGSHYERMKNFIARLTASQTTPDFPPVRGDGKPQRTEGE